GEIVRERYELPPDIMVVLFPDYMLHKNNPNHAKIVDVEKRILLVGCRTNDNFTDCGIKELGDLHQVPGIEVHNSEKDNLGGPDQTVDRKAELAVRKGKLVVLVEKLIRNKLIK
nr:ulp1 protease family, C-terminal catalytic domain-containing protein [Tanacetum cinerariifolium]